MDFTTITIELLKSLSHLVGSYGLGIILLTVVIRLAMWPLGVSQQRSMKTMQTLQPKMKAIQERYKSTPEVMQKKMMEFYKEHKFNPMSGCFPLLVQMPIFILLYSALMSPQFIQIAGNSQFLFVKRLDATLKTTAGISYDGVMGVSKYDNFMLGKTATVYLPKGEILENVKVEKPNKALEIQGDLKPGEPIDFKVSLDSLDLKFSQLDQIQKAEFTVSNLQNKESEKLEFVRKNGLLVAALPSKEVKSSFHYDVLLLIILFGLTMVATQKIMMASQPAQTDPNQQAIQKSMGIFMPIMVTATFVFIPIPAGVLLYLISSNVIQVAQTVIINKQLDDEDKKKKQKIDNDDVKIAKKIEAKEVKDI